MMLSNSRTKLPPRIDLRAARIAPVPVFDFEELLAAAVTAVVNKRSRKKFMPPSPSPSPSARRHHR
jgi:hypothetical protein